MEQLLYHLLSNALKFTAAGGTVTVELKKRGEQLLLSVADTGCGIPPERLEHLFDSCLQPQMAAPPPWAWPGPAHLSGRRGAATAAGSPWSPFSSRAPASLSPCRTGQLGTQVSDVPPLYDSGFNRPLLGLADALPAEAYTIRNQD